MREGYADYVIWLWQVGVVLVVVLAGILDVDGRVQRTHFRGRTNND